ncbi:MAG: P22 phage major capsid protein family protein [Candidatus Binatia bacterium]
MANTLTGLFPVLYNAMNVVSREMVGLVAAVSRDATASQAALNQTVRSPVVGAMTAADITPGNIAASGTDQTIETVDISISKSRKVSFNLTGEEERGLGSSNQTIAEQRFAQAMRTLVNEMEDDLAALYVNASRAYGTAGTVPFGTGDDLTALTETMRILDDNGAPRSDRHVVLGSAAVAKLLGKQPALFKVNEAGSAIERRFGELQPMFGAQMHSSGQIRAHTPGGATGRLVNEAAGYAVGDTSITFDTGSGAFLAGDVVTFDGNDEQYVVQATATTPLVLNNPGLILAIADDDAIAVQAAYTANMAFSRDAIQLAARVPATPTGGDQADDRMIVTDPMSGVSFEVSVYRQYRQVSYEVAAAWGVKAVKGEHLALLIG